MPTSDYSEHHMYGIQTVSDKSLSLCQSFVEIKGIMKYNQCYDRRGGE